MGVNVPKFDRCCVCIPLRAGLLTLGYINLVYHGLLFIMASFVAFSVTMLTISFAGKFPPLEVWLLLPLVTVSEVTFYVFVLLATHMKDARLLRATLILGTALLIFTVPYSVCIVYRLARAENTLPEFDDNDLRNRFKLPAYITAAILEPIILAYTLLLVRSLKLKLRGEARGEYIDLDREPAADYERLLPTMQ